jgi:hypothetical protein
VVSGAAKGAVPRNALQQKTRNAACSRTSSRVRTAAGLQETKHELCDEKLKKLLTMS